MQEAIERRWQRTGGALLRAATGTRMTLVICMGASVKPQWVAKIATNDTGRDILAREYQALRELEPWAESLGIPRCDDWKASPPTCLIMEGLAGRPGHGLAEREIEICLDRALIWLRKLQTVVPARKISARDYWRETWMRSQLDPDPAGTAHTLLTWLGKQPPQEHALTASHGDFWLGNLLLDGGEIKVFDWGCYDTRGPLDDAYTLLLHAMAPAPNGHCDLESFRGLFWENRDMAGRCAAIYRTWKITAEQARWEFYMFLARRIRWETGLEGQFRSPAFRLNAQQRWAAIGQWLRERNYPFPPGTAVPETQTPGNRVQSSV